jgi:protein-S-isoprenylcysteine O-methyltransferase Ste14
VGRTLAITVASLLVIAALLFGSAGRLDWPMAWVFLATWISVAIAGFAWLDPELIRERARPSPGFDRVDAVLASAAFVVFGLLPLAVAGLDVGRLHWTPPLPLAVRIAALAVFVLGNAFSLRAAKHNPFFSDFVRIQTERGHHVVASGPYARIRHPGYAGAIPTYLAVPVALGSLWGVVPALLGLALLVVRAAREDRFLHERLDGYRDYAARVRWRLLPGVW